MRVCRSIVAFFLLLPFAVPLLFLSFLQLRQAYIKHGMEERLETHMIKTFFVPQQKWRQLNSREILVDGKLFDLKEVRKESSGFNVTGVFDEDEMAVLQQITQACSATNLKDTPVFAQFFHLLHGLFFQAAACCLWAIDFYAKLFQNPIAALPFCYQQVALPPPQLASSLFS